MKKHTKRNIGGFTLIELLVVVLIIGILAAVAVPQYSIAVEKTRLMRLLPIVNAIDKAEKIYFLENSSYSSTFSNLSIDMPGGGEIKNGDSGVERFKYDNFTCWISPADNSCYCQINGALQIEKYFDKDYYICWARNEKSEKVCKSISGKSTPDSAYDTSKGYRF